MIKRYEWLLFVFILFVLPTGVVLSQDSSFILTTNNFEKYFPTYIGNGYVSLSSSRLGTLPAESYMAKVYDQAHPRAKRKTSKP